MKKFLRMSWGKCVLVISAALLSQGSFAQINLFNKVELGFTLAPSNFLGDLGGNLGRGTTFLKDNNFSQTRMMFGAHLTAMPTDWLGFRFAANFGSISGKDNIIKGKGGLEEARYNRNSDFKSSIAEGFVAAEIYPTVFFEEDPSDVFHKIRPYGMIGIGAFHFNPKGLDPKTNDWVALAPLHTEGQTFDEYPDRPAYSLTSMIIPMGVGFKYFASENTAISFEIVHRKTFSDYIDDVSTQYVDPALFDKYFGAGSPKAELAKRMANKSLGNVYKAGDKRGTATNKDAYYSVGFKISFTLNSDRGYRNSTRCPTMRF
jgi:Domain of unknown function (DUF6089)